MVERPVSGPDQFVNTRRPSPEKEAGGFFAYACATWCYLVMSCVTMRLHDSNESSAAKRAATSERRHGPTASPRDVSTARCSRTRRRALAGSRERPANTRGADGLKVGRTCFGAWWRGTGRRAPRGRSRARLAGSPSKRSSHDHDDPAVGRTVQATWLDSPVVAPAPIPWPRHRMETSV